MNGSETFPCPYCGVEVRSGDKHAQIIEKKNLKDTPTIIVTCMLVRIFAVTCKEIETK